MNVDIDSLGRFNRMAHEGAEQAAANLSEMTGIEAFVDVTKVSVVPTEDVIRRRSGERVSVTVDFDGGLCGRTVLAFAPESVRTILDALVSGWTGELDDVDRSAIREVGNILTSGFIDGWAEYLGATIDVSPPTVSDGSEPAALPDEAADAVGGEYALVFRSQVDTVEGGVEFEIHMFLDRDSLERILDGGEEGRLVSLDRLAAFTRMTRTGAITVSENLSAMIGIETTVEITNLDFVPVEEVCGALSTTSHVGVVVEFDGVPSGYVVILLTESSAREVVDALVPDSDGSAGFDEMDRSAVRELGNVMSSSFVDGWANVLDTTIDISPPQFVHDMERAIVDPIAARLGRNQEFAFFFDATILANDRTFDCGIYAFPDEAELRQALATLDVDETAERYTNRGSLDIE